jgi:hypothetical protein
MVIESILSPLVLSDPQIVVIHENKVMPDGCRWMWRVFLLHGQQTRLLILIPTRTPILKPKTPHVLSVDEFRLQLDSQASTTQLRGLFYRLLQNTSFLASSYTHYYKLTTATARLTGFGIALPGPYVTCGHPLSQRIRWYNLIDDFTPCTRYNKIVSQTTMGSFDS